MNSEQRIAELEKKNRQLKAELEQLKKERQHEVDHKQKQLLEQILNDIPVGVALHEGPEFITTVVNKSYYDFAYGKGDIINRKVEDVWPEVADQILPLLTKVYKTGEPHHATDAEFTVERGKGPEKAWFSFSYLPFRGEKDKITGILVWSFETTPYVLSRKKAENTTIKIAESEKRFRLATDTAEFGIFEWDAKSDRPIWENKRIYDIFGLSPDEKPVTKKELEKEFIHPEDLPRFETAMDEGMKKGSRFSVQCRIQRRNDQQWRWIEYYSNFELSADGDPIRLIGFVADVTNKIAAEEALRKSERNFRALLNAATSVIYNMNADWSEMRKLNSKNFISEMLEPSKEWMDEYIHPSDQAMVASKIREAIDSKSVFDLEHRVTQVDGSLGWTHSRAVPLLNKEGEILEWLGMADDITKRKKAEFNLLKNEEKYRAVFEQAAIGIGRVNFDDAKWIDVNATFCRMVGYEAKELKNIPWPKITHPDDIDLDLIPFKKMAAGKLDNYSVEKRFIHKEGHFIWARLTLSLIRDDRGRPDSEIAVIENITERKQAEEALQRSEERWNLALENFAEGAIIATEDEQVIYWNPAAREMHGFTHPAEGIEPLVDTSVTFQLCTPDGHHLLELDEWPMRRIKRGEKMCEITNSGCAGLDQGWEKYVSYSGSMVETANDEKLIFLSVHDLTEEWKSELALRESEERFRTLADNISQLAWMANEKGSIFWYNKRWYDYTGTTLDVMQGGGWKKLQHPDHADRVIKKFQQSLDSGERWEDIFPIRGKNGSYRWFLSRAVPVHDEKGNVIRWFGTNTDITEQRRSEKLLRNQNRMLDQVQDAIIGLDNDGKISYLNEAAFELYEIKKDSEILGSKPEDYFTVQWDSTNSENELYSKLEKIGTWKGENIHKTAKGKRLWIESVVSAVKDDKEKITGIISAMRDVTHRKKLEEALNIQLKELQKANDLFENILYIIAHDLKGPIANMYMALNLIDSVQQMQEKIRMLEMFRPLVQRVENTIKGVTGLLQVQKTNDSAAFKLDFESILNDILLEHKESLRPGALESDFKRKTIYYIEPFLTSIMKNLINNAIKYSRENVPLQIKVSTENKNGFILMTVKDNGIGIDLKKHRKELFYPFKRFTPKKAEGTGIGLYIIKNTVEKNGGYIEVESTPGEGTAFFCYLKEYKK